MIGISVISKYNGVIFEYMFMLDSKLNSCDNSCSINGNQKYDVINIEKVILNISDFVLCFSFSFLIFIILNI